MAKCKLCERKGFFFSVNQDGLCKTCEPIVSMNVDERLRVINDCVELVNESEDMKTRLSSYDLLIKHARALLEYEVRGIPTIKPHPSYFVIEYNARRDQIVLEVVTQEVEKMLA